MDSVMNHSNAIGTIEVDGNVATWTLQMEGRANKINEAYIRGFTEGVDWLANQPGLSGVVLTSGHKDFCVGADLDFVFQERDPARLMEGVTALDEAYRRLECLGIPVVALLNGSALGGGYELALATHHRICVDSPRIQLGLPEVNLGVIPGAGGTQRLPRIIGIQPAVELIAQAKILRAPKALSAGLVDELVPDLEAGRAAALAWIAANPRAKQPWDQSGFRFKDLRPGSPEARNVIMAGAAMLFKKTAGAFPAAEAVLTVIQEGTSLAFDGAMKVEARAFTRLATSDQAKDMIRTFWYHRTAAERQLGLPQLPKGTDPGLQKLGVLGAGMMGAGIAFIAAKAGMEVVLKDIRAEALAAGMAHVEAEVGRLRHLDADARAALLGRVKGSLELADLEGCDLVIEAVLEHKGVKHAVTRETEPLLSANGIWASNTSALPITELAEASAHPDRFIGLHFFSPVEKMPLLEIIRGAATSDETVARCLALSRALGKLPIVVNDGYGFFTSRVFASYILEGVALVAEGHDPVLVEWAARTAGMVVPPLQVFDEVTLALGRHVLDASREYTGLSLPMAEALVVAMVDEEKRPGRSAGAGFYTYVGGKRQEIWPGLAPLAQRLGAATPEKTGVSLLSRRLLLAQVAEVGRAMDDGVLNHPRDVEVGAIFGIGFAPNTGGPLAWVDRQGAAQVVAELEALAVDHGDRFTPPQVFRDMAARGERFFPA